MGHPLGGGGGKGRGGGGGGVEKEGAGRFEVASSCLVRPRRLGINYHMIKCKIV